MAAPCRPAFSRIINRVLHHERKWFRCCRFQSQFVPLALEFPKQDEEDEIYKRLRLSMAPWQQLTHEQQLHIIQRRSVLSMRKFKNIMAHMKGDKTQWKAHLAVHDDLPCEITDVKPSPILDGYRNKDSYLIGLDVDGQPDIGFYIRSAKSTFPRIPVDGRPVRMTKPLHHHLSRGFLEIVKESGFPSQGYIYNEAGTWKTLLVRSNQAGEVMVATCVSPYSASRSSLDAVRDKVYEYFVHGEGKQFGVVSLYHQEQSGLTHIHNSAQTLEPYIHLHGNHFLVESILGRKFRIHPASFFQVNTLAAEVLYTTIEQLCGMSRDTVLLDVCCGTGTIGILMADKVKKVYGIELVQAAIDDAKVNCEMNNVDNMEFYQGRAESLMKTVINKHVSPGDNVVVVLNPGRSGVGKRVLKAIRRCESIKRVVYASCKPMGRATHNFVLLSSPENDKVDGEPFMPTKAVPVEMFPHAGHFELVIQFDR